LNKKNLNEKNFSNLHQSIINNLYKKILFRDVDEFGLSHYTKLLENKSITLEEIEKQLIESDEGKDIRSFTHYFAKYWNNLELVKRYKNKLATGKENLHWIDDILIRFKKFVPFKRVLIVGCGNGWLERKLFDMGIGLEFDSFDISKKYIQEAKEKRGERPINYFIENVNEMKSIENDRYDAVFNFAILHHAAKVDFAVKKLSQVLKKTGLLFNEEYIGPSKNQYSNEHLKIMLNVMSDLPEYLRSKYPLRPHIMNFRIEPTEAIHSDQILSSFKRYFDVVYERNLNGGIAYQILWNNIEKFEDTSDKEASKWLEYLLEKDDELSKNGKVQILFWYSVGTPK